MAEGSYPTILPNIAYVDELEDARHDFLTDAYQSGLFNEIHVLPPEQTIPAMVEVLFDLKIDAVISDWKLTAAGPVEYNGEQLVEAVLSKRSGFPCFIQTSFDDEALLVADDVNRVYSKIPRVGDGSRAHLLQRVAIQIRHHEERVATWHEELEQLLSIDREKLSGIQVERILELDEFIEQNIGLDDPVAKQAKRDLLRDQNLGRYHAKLVDEAEKLVAQMRDAIND